MLCNKRRVPETISAPAMVGAPDCMHDVIPHVHVTLRACCICV